jgi:hypothetical protein
VLQGGVTVLACSVGAGTIVAGPSDLYWLGWNPDRDPPTGTLLTMPKAGGPVRALADVEDGLPSLRVSGTRVFWTDRRDGREGGVLQSIDVSGAGLTTLADSLRRPGSLALDDTYAYFGLVGGNFRVPLSGGEVEFVADGLTVQMQVVGDTLYWLDHQGIQTDLGLREALSVFRTPVDGGAEPELLARSFEDPDSLLVVQNRIFWTTRSQGEIWSMDVGGGTQTLVVENPLDEWDFCCKLVSDGESLYLPRSGWPNDHPEKDGIVRVSLDGVEVEELVLQRFIEDMAVDEEFIYFTGRMETPDGPSPTTRARSSVASMRTASLVLSPASALVSVDALT